MTLHELEESLPNGFHDAWFRRIEIDYASRRVSIGVDVLVGLPEEPPGERDRLRSGTLVLEGLEFAAIERPRTRQTGAHRRGLRVELVDSRATDAADLPKGCFVASFHLSDLNASILLAALDAKLEWSQIET